MILCIYGIVSLNSSSEDCIYSSEEDAVSSSSESCSDCRMTGECSGVSGIVMLQHFFESWSHCRTTGECSTVVSCTVMLYSSIEAGISSSESCSDGRMSGECSGVTMILHCSLGSITSSSSTSFMKTKIVSF